MSCGRTGGIQSGVWWETACVTDWSFRIRREGNDSYGMCIDSYGNVGIGTMSPNAKLEVSGDITFSGNKMVITGGSQTLYLRDSNLRTGMLHQNDNRMYFLSGVANSDSWSQTANGKRPLYLQTDTNAAVFGGIVGIGKSPFYKFDVNGLIWCGGGCRVYGEERYTNYTNAGSDYLTNGGNLQVDPPPLSFGLYVDRSINAAGIVE